MKDLKIIVRYCGRQKLPALELPSIPIVGEVNEEHVVKILMGFQDVPGVRAFEHRENAHLPALMFPGDEERQAGEAIACAIRAAADYFDELVTAPDQKETQG